MPSLKLRLTSAQFRRLRSSLLPEGDTREHAAFLFASTKGDALEVVHVELLTSTELAEQSYGYLELRDGALQEMIVRAHKMKAALVEAHSHPFSRGLGIEFSPFDRDGLREVAPHVVWRLSGRPYAALVFGRDAFDGLYWAEGRPEPSGPIQLVVDGRGMRASGVSLRRWRSR